MSTVFIAGATGYTGNALVRRLAADPNLRVVAHVRPDSSRLDAWRERFGAQGAEVDTTAWEADAMTARMASLTPDRVFSLLGTTRARQSREARSGVSKEANSYETVDYGLTKLLYDAVASGAAGARFVYLSSMGVRETSNAYLHVRWRIEQALAAGTVPWTSIRPSFITGPDRAESRPGERIGAALGDGLLGLVGALGARKARDRYRSITADELAAAMIHWSVAPEGADRVVEADELRGHAV